MLLQRMITSIHNNQLPKNRGDFEDSSPSEPTTDIGIPEVDLELKTAIGATQDKKTESYGHLN